MNIFKQILNGNYGTLTETLSKVDDWLKSNKLKCNLDKSEAIFLKKSSEHDLHLGALANDMQLSLNYLSVVIDNYLRFREHAAKIERKLNFCHHTVRRSHDLLTEFRTLVYYILHVNPLIQYGILIYGWTSFSIVSPIYTKTILQTMMFFEKFGSVDSLMIRTMNFLPLLIPCLCTDQIHCSCTLN